MSASYSGNNAAKAGKIVNILKARFGDIPWWPGDTEEVMIGVILTQQTRGRMWNGHFSCSKSGTCVRWLP